MDSMIRKSTTHITSPAISLIRGGGYKEAKSRVVIVIRPVCLVIWSEEQVIVIF